MPTALLNLIAIDVDRIHNSNGAGGKDAGFLAFRVSREERKVVGSDVDGGWGRVSMSFFLSVRS